MNKKTIMWLLIIAGAGAAAYFGYQFYLKKKKLAETTQKVLGNPELRNLASERAARNKTTLQTEAEIIAAKAA